MMTLVMKLVQDEAGQDLAEYGIALAVIAVGAGAIALAVGTDVQSLWSNAQSDIHVAAVAGS
jgi:Flp pilus assembly pilin Flp